MAPLTIAVTGGIGAGKSQALWSFAQRGVPVLSADDVVHDLLAGDSDIRAAIEARFGTTDRRRIGEIVFADREELAWLEGLLHPRVREVTDAWLAAREAPVAVVEIPLLYETGGESRFDRVLVITASAEVREARVERARDGRSDRLIPDEEKAGRANFVYVNDGTLDELDAFVGELLERLLA